MTKPSNSLLSDFYESFHRERKKQGTVSIPARFDFIKRSVGTDKDIIELGCRYGDILSLVKEGNRLTGVDVDRGALVQCASRTGARVLVANLNERLPFDDMQFDVVLLTEVLEHLPYPEITLSEAARILRPNGVLVGSVPNAVTLRNRVRFAITGIVELDRTHLHHFSAKALDSKLRKYFSEAEVMHVGGRYARLSSELFASMLLFKAVK